MGLCCTTAFDGLRYNMHVYPIGQAATATTAFVVAFVVADEDLEGNHQVVDLDENLVVPFAVEGNLVTIGLGNLVVIHILAEVVRKLQVVVVDRILAFLPLVVVVVQIQVVAIHTTIEVVAIRIIEEVAVDHILAFLPLVVAFEAVHILVIP